MCVTSFSLQRKPVSLLGNVFVSFELAAFELRRTAAVATAVKSAVVAAVSSAKALLLGPVWTSTK